MDAGELLDKVRAIALEQPLVTERVSHGHPGWFIESSPQFASFMDRHHGVDWVAAGIASPEALAINICAQRHIRTFLHPVTRAGMTYPGTHPIQTMAQTDATMFWCEHVDESLPFNNS